MGQRGKKPKTHPYTFDNLQSRAKVLALQRERVSKGEDTNARVLPQLLVILSDMLGDIRSPILDSIVTRGRHFGVSLLADSQVVRGLGANARKNFSMWCIGRLPMSDWKIFEDEKISSYEIQGVYGVFDIVIKISSDDEKLRNLITNKIRKIK